MTLDIDPQIKIPSQSYQTHSEVGNLQGTSLLVRQMLCFTVYLKDHIILEQFPLYSYKLREK